MPFSGQQIVLCGNDQTALMWTAKYGNPDAAQAILDAAKCGQYHIIRAFSNARQRWQDCINAGSRKQGNTAVQKILEDTAQKTAVAENREEQSERPQLF